MTQPEITVYGAYWCADCRRSKQFLGEHQIPYNWADIERETHPNTLALEVAEVRYDREAFSSQYVIGVISGESATAFPYKLTANKKSVGSCPRSFL